MAADGSQYLVTQQTNVTTRGDTSASNHSQTITYNNVQDRSIKNLTDDKIVTQEVAHKAGESDEAETTVKVPRSVQITVEIDFLGATIMC